MGSAVSSRKKAKEDMVVPLKLPIGGGKAPSVIYEPASQQMDAGASEEPEPEHQAYEFYKPLSAPTSEVGPWDDEEDELNEALDLSSSMIQDLMDDSVVQDLLNDSAIQDAGAAPGAGVPCGSKIPPRRETGIEQKNLKDLQCQSPAPSALKAAPTVLRTPSCVRCADARRRYIVHFH